MLVTDVSLSSFITFQFCFEEKPSSCLCVLTGPFSAYLKDLVCLHPLKTFWSGDLWKHLLFCNLAHILTSVFVVFHYICIFSCLFKCNVIWHVMICYVLNVSFHDYYVIIKELLWLISFDIFPPSALIWQLNVFANVIV